MICEGDCLLLRKVVSFLQNRNVFIINEDEDKKDSSVTGSLLVGNLWLTG